jgi:hypothetical protein
MSAQDTPEPGRVRRFNERTISLLSDALTSLWYFWIALLLIFLSLPALITALDDELKRALGIERLPDWLTAASRFSLIAWILETVVAALALPILAYRERVGERESDEMLAEVRELVAALESANVSRERQDPPVGNERGAT